MASYVYISPNMIRYDLICLYITLYGQIWQYKNFYMTWYAHMWPKKLLKAYPDPGFIKNREAIFHWRLRTRNLRMMSQLKNVWTFSGALSCYTGEEKSGQLFGAFRSNLKGRNSVESLVRVSYQVIYGYRTSWSACFVSSRSEFPRWWRSSGGLSCLFVLFP